MKVGVVQMCLTESIIKNVGKILDFIKIATEENIEILQFPETALTGYIFDDFIRLNYNEVSAALQDISENVMENKVTVLVGTPFEEEGEAYNSIVIMHPNGESLIYHKNNLVPYETRFFKVGSTKIVFQVNNVKFGVMICKDQNYPDLAKELHNMGAQGIFISSAHYYDLIESKMKIEKNIALPIARAYENNCFVFKANAVGTLKKRISYGNSMIIDPRGIVILKGDDKREELLVHDIDFQNYDYRW